MVVALLTPRALPASAGERVDLEQLNSRYVKVGRPRFSTVTTVWTHPEDPASNPVRGRINLDLSNKSDRSFWMVVQLTPPSPYPSRTGTVYLEPKENTEFESTQDSILADTDYLLDIEVFGDSLQADTLEANATRIRFSAKTVKDLDRRLEQERLAFGARTLPKTYEEVQIRDSFGLSGMLQVGWKIGTLAVTREGLEFISKKKTIQVSAEQIRTVSIQDVTPEGEMVIVEYKDGSKAKKLGFRSLREPNQLLRASLSAITSSQE